MRKIIIGAAITLALSACGGDSSGTTGPSAPLNIAGTFIGDYTATVDPGTVYQGVLQLAQSGSNVSGTLTTNAGRSANVSGTVSGTRLTATFTFTDGCTGSASTTADITNGTSRLTGNYSANDCVGSYTGGFALNKQ
jgi:hypothetical protein